MEAASAAAKEVNKSSLVVGLIAHKGAPLPVKAQPINRSAVLSVKTILDSLAVPDSANPSYYIFNYEGGGFVIIPADKRLEPVISYSDKGYLPYSGRLPSGLTNWLSVTNKNIQRLRKNTSVKQKPGMASLWAEFSTTSAIINRSLVITGKVAPAPPPCQPTSSTQTVGPLLQTAWAQGYPYNILCPAGNYTDAFTPTGCVATAMAQVMYYWQFPTNYNWGIMPLTANYTSSNASNLAVATLMRDIGTDVAMQYSNSGSSPYISPFPFYYTITCTAAFKNDFKYRSSTEASFNYESVVSNLNVGEPVLLTGDTNTDGHEWVCDGYQQTTSTWCASNGNPAGGETVLLFDMNWGWNELNSPYGNVDGWYDFNYWSVLNGTTQEYYQYNLAMTYNIHP